MKINNLLFLIAVLVIASFLRLWNLAHVPNALTPDEAALGYNAYSILKTGRDEYGEFLPVIFKSFGDYKPGLYVYLTIPSVFLLGLNEFAVRLPSALAGILSVWLIYLITNKLFDKKFGIWNLEFGIFAAFSVAVSPWHIFFSRGAWEANVSLTLTLFGIYFFLKSFSKPFYLILSSFFFSLTLLTYQGGKLSSLIVLVSLFSVYRVKLLSIDKKYWFKACLLGLVIITPILLSFGSGQTGRLKVFSVFSYPRPQEYLQNFLNQGSEKVGEVKYYLFHSETLNFTRGVMGRWFNHFSGKFLFFQGDYQNPGHSAPNHGMLLLSDMVFLVLGFVFIFNSKILNPKSKALVLLWLIFSPLPAVLSRDQVQSVRALNMAVPLSVISGMGTCYLLSIINKLKYRLPVYILCCLLFTLSFIYFLDAYFVHMGVHNAKYLAYGYKEASIKVSEVKSLYKKIVFQQSYAQPYIYFLFFQGYDPKAYQSQAGISDGGIDVGLVSKLDNIEFVNFSWPYRTGEENTLIIGNEVAIPPDFSKDSYNLVWEIKYPDNFAAAFRLVETKNK